MSSVNNGFFFFFPFSTVMVLLLLFLLARIQYSVQCFSDMYIVNINFLSMIFFSILTVLSGDGGYSFLVPDLTEVSNI